MLYLGSQTCLCLREDCFLGYILAVYPCQGRTARYPLPSSWNAQAIDAAEVAEVADTEQVSFAWKGTVNQWPDNSPMNSRFRNQLIIPHIETLKFSGVWTETKVFSWLVLPWTIINIMYHTRSITSNQLLKGMTHTHSVIEPAEMENRKIILGWLMDVRTSAVPLGHQTTQPAVWSETTSSG